MELSPVSRLCRLFHGLCGEKGRRAKVSHGYGSLQPQDGEAGDGENENRVLAVASLHGQDRGGLQG